MNNKQELLNIVYTDNSEFECNIEIKCPYKERSLSYAIGVEIPIPSEDPVIAFKECCYTHRVFADLNSSEDFKNDYSSFYHQRQLSTESVDFVLVDLSTDVEHNMNDGTFGLFFDYGSFDSNLDLKGYMIKWKKVLSELGVGNYQIIKRQNIAGIDVEFKSMVFTLKQFTSEKADKTVRVDVVMSGRLIKTGVDFTGTAWKHSIRVPGFFGRREPGIEEDNLINRVYEKRQISIKQTNEWKFQTNSVPSCITNEFWDFILMSNDIFMNDYNLNNHSYDFVKFGVKFASNDGTGYGSKTRKAKLNLTFTDKFENQIKRNFN